MSEVIGPEMPVLMYYKFSIDAKWSLEVSFPSMMSAQDSADCIEFLAIVKRGIERSAVKEPTC